MLMSRSECCYASRKGGEVIFHGLIKQWKNKVAVRIVDKQLSNEYLFTTLLPLCRRYAIPSLPVDLDPADNADMRCVGLSR